MMQIVRISDGKTWTEEELKNYVVTTLPDFQKHKFHTCSLRYEGGRWTVNYFLGKTLNWFFLEGFTVTDTNCVPIAAVRKCYEEIKAIEELRPYKGFTDAIDLAMQAFTQLLPELAKGMTMDNEKSVEQSCGSCKHFERDITGDGTCFYPLPIWLNKFGAGAVMLKNEGTDCSGGRGEVALGF